MHDSKDRSRVALLLNKVRGLEETDSAGGGSSLGLEPEAYEETYARIGWTALVYAVTYLLAFGIDWLLTARQSGAAPRADASVVIAIASIAFGLIVWWIARLRLVPPRRFGSFAYIYSVLGAFGICASAWGWEKTAPLSTPVIGIPWVCVWILVLPSLVPAAPRLTLAAGLSAAFTAPIVLLASVIAHGVPIGPDVRRFIFSIFYPALICSGIAHWMSVMMHRLRRDAARMRRMGSYQLVERIGAGGMGEVWRAKHRLLVRPAAIKLIRPDVLGANPAAKELAIRRFEREAQSTAALSSPHTVELHDFGVTEDGTFYFVMELLDGMDLRSLIERFGPVPPERAVHLLRQVCHSLHDAHAIGLVHRDIKPANVFACRRGQEHDFVKVLDFGLVAAAKQHEKGATQLTAQGVVTGTPAFMAPEMAMSAAPAAPQVDIYSLGCVAFWLMTGQLLFDGPSPMAILLQHAKDAPPSLRTHAPFDVPPSLEQVVSECLEKEPGRRPRSIRDLSERLARVAEEMPAWTPDRAERWWKLHLPEPAAHVPASHLELTRELDAARI